MTEEPVSLLVPIDPARFEQLEHVIEHGLGPLSRSGARCSRSSNGACIAQPGTGRSPTMSRNAGICLDPRLRQIEASKVVDILSPIGDMPLPANEAQARELAPLVDDPEAFVPSGSRPCTMARAGITARSVREHVTARHPRARHGSLQSRAG